MIIEDEVAAIARLRAYHYKCIGELAHRLREVQAMCTHPHDKQRHASDSFAGNDSTTCTVCQKEW